MGKRVEQGLTMINTGRGKGKTTAALGAVLRAAGQGLRVLVIQFIKAGGYYGELDRLALLPEVEVRSMGMGQIRPCEDLEPHRAAAREAWDQTLAETASGNWDLVVLDEIWAAVGRGFVAQSEAAELMRDKPEGMHLILTGRGCPPELFDLADTVTVMEDVKHHMAAGVPTQSGVEY